MIPLGLLLRSLRCPTAAAGLLVLGVLSFPAGASVINTFATGAGGGVGLLDPLTFPPVLTSQEGQDSGLEQTISSVDIIDADVNTDNDIDGTARAEASFVAAGPPGLNTPLLKVLAQSLDPHGFVYAYAYGLDVFSNDTGTVIDDVRLDLSLDALVDLPPGTLGAIAASAIALKADSSFVSDLLTDIENQDLNDANIEGQLDAIIAGAEITGELVDATTDDLVINYDTNDSKHSVSTSLDLGDIAHGESVLYFNFVSAIAIGDGPKLDAFNTLTTTVENGAGLTSASSQQILEPGVLGLLVAGGLMGVAADWRRRKPRSLSDLG